MRALRSAVCLIALTQFSFSARAESEGPHCAFADESFVTFFTIASATTEYYARHHVWPSSTNQLRAEILRSIASSPPIAAMPTAKDIDQLFARFSRIKLVPRNRDLILDTRYQAEGKTFTRRILIHPGKNSDEMLQGSVEVK